MTDPHDIAEVIHSTIHDLDVDSTEPELATALGVLLAVAMLDSGVNEFSISDLRSEASGREYTVSVKITPQ